MLHFYDWEWSPAERECRRAIELKPGPSDARSVLSLLLAQIGRSEEAIAEATAAIHLDPLDPFANRMLAHVLNLSALSLEPDDPASLMSRAWILGTIGRTEEAQDVVSRLERRRREGHFSACLMGVCYLGLGDADTAFKWLNTGCDERDAQCLNLNGYFMFDPLRSDPRFQALLQRMNFPSAG